MIVVAGIVLAAVIIAFVMFMLLTRRLREKYAVLWLVIGVVVLVVGVFPGLLTSLSSVLGVQLPSNFIFGAAILLLLGVALHLSWELSQVEDETRRLAEESAILRAEVDALRESMRGDDPRGDAAVDQAD